MKTETKQQLREQLNKALVERNELNEKFKDIERRLKDSETQRESIRKRFVERRERVEELEALLGIENHDPDLSDKYKIVHPDNVWWMEYSDAYITINTHGDESECHVGRKQRVCTIPIPNLNLAANWHHKVPTIRVWQDGEWQYVESDAWAMVSEDDKGQVWERPSVEIGGRTYPSETVLVETREQFDARRRVMTNEHIALLLDTARTITDLYSKIGGWPDNEVSVDVEINNIQDI